MKTHTAALTLCLGLASSLAVAQGNKPIPPQRLHWPVPEAACQAVRQQAYLSYREANRPPGAEGEAVIIFPNDGNCRYWVMEQISPTLLYMNFDVGVCWLAYRFVDKGKYCQPNGWGDMYLKVEYSSQFGWHVVNEE